MRGLTMFAGIGARDLDSRPWHISRAALVLGVVSVLSALAIGVATYRFTTRATELRFRDFYLAQARLLLAGARLEGDISDESFLGTLETLWMAFEDRPADEHICVVDADSRLILHTTQPEYLGRYVGDSVVGATDGQPPRFLKDLVHSQEDYVGRCVDSAGQEEVAAFTAIPQRRWMLGVHRSRAALLGEIRAELQFLAIGLVLVCGVLMPIALVLLARTFQIAQQRRRRAEERSEIILRQTIDGFCVMDTEGRILEVSDAYCDMVGYAREELLSMGLRDLEAVESLDDIADHMRQIREVGARRFESRHRRKDGTLVDLELSTNYLDRDGGRWFTFFRDISERKRSERALRDERDKAQKYLDIAGVVLVAIDAEQRVTLINKRGCEILGYRENEIVGRNWFDNFLPARERDLVKPVFEKLVRGELEPAGRFENPVLTKDGAERLIAWHNTVLRDDAGRITGTLSSGEDITDRRQAEQEREELEAQLRQAQKMEAVGQLAGGVAHDFNNILTAILGNAELLLEKMVGQFALDSPVLEGLRQIEEGAERAALLTRQLLAFSRRQLLQLQVLDLNQALSGMKRMLRRLLSEDIDLTLELSPDLRCIRADRNQIEQVIMNLVVNARDAMADGGTLTLQTANVDLDAGYVAAHAETRPGPHVLLAVRDTGCGMDAETIDHIFEPFFTTKAVGKGTGLGLATVYGIVKQAGGHVQVDSQPRQGTTFRVYLPAVAAPADQPETSRAVDDSRAGSGTILVCEDAEAVRNLAVQILTRAGYAVLAAENGEQALQLAAKHHEPVRLLVTDVIMPGMNGKRLSDTLSAANPSLKTLFVSGYAANVIAQHGVLDDGVQFLEKPFDRRDLLRRVRQILDQDGPGVETPPD